MGNIWTWDCNGKDQSRVEGEREGEGEQKNEEGEKGKVVRIEEKVEKKKSKIAGKKIFSCAIFDQYQVSIGFVEPGKYSRGLVISVWEGANSFIRLWDPYSQLMIYEVFFMIFFSFQKKKKRHFLGERAKSFLANSNFFSVPGPRIVSGTFIDITKYVWSHK